MIIDILALDAYGTLTEERAFCAVPGIMAQLENDSVLSRSYSIWHCNSTTLIRVTEGQSVV